jgi:hypothetical protein
VLINKTDGANIISGEKTQCETHRRRIILASLHGSMDNETLIGRLLDPESDEEVELTPENRKSSNDALGNLINSFKKWAEGILNESKSFSELINNINFTRNNSMYNKMHELDASFFACNDNHFWL